MQNDPERAKKQQERYDSEPNYRWLLSRSSLVSETDEGVERLSSTVPLPTLDFVKTELENAIATANELSALYVDSGKTRKLKHSTGTVTPYLPKSPKSAFNKQTKINDFLVLLFNDMEVYAVFFEQVLWDLDDSYGLYEHQFNKSNEKNSLILTELQDLIVATKSQDKVEPFDRSVMPSDERCLDKSGTENRNFYIASAYKNYLEDALEVLTLLAKNKS